MFGFPWFVVAWLAVVVCLAVAWAAASAAVARSRAGRVGIDLDGWDRSVRAWFEGRRRG